MNAPIRAVYEKGHLRLLEPVQLVEGEEVAVAILRQQTSETAQESRPFSARQLLALPLNERDRVLAAAAQRAEHDYRIGV